MKNKKSEQIIRQILNDQRARILQTHPMRSELTGRFVSLYIVECSDTVERAVILYAGEFYYIWEITEETDDDGTVVSPILMELTSTEPLLRAS